jgi:hypothetical protein
MEEGLINSSMSVTDPDPHGIATFAKAVPYPRHSEKQDPDLHSQKRIRIRI